MKTPIRHHIMWCLIRVCTVCLCAFYGFPGNAGVALPEIDTRRPYEYGILNFGRRSPRTWSTANFYPKQVRCRWSHYGTRTAHEGNTTMWFLITKCTRRPDEGHSTALRHRIESTMRTSQVSKAL